MNVFDLVAVLSLNKKDFSSGLKSAEGEASNFGSKIKSGFGTIAKVGGALMTVTTGAMVGFGKSAVSAGLEFDKAMSQVAATMGKSVDEIQELRDFAQDMGATTAFSATEAAEALNYMALAGYDAETSMMMLPNVLNLAAAGDMELARASDMVTDAQTALGLSLEDTNVMVDQMAKISSTTNTSVAQLGDALLTVGGNAKVVKGGTAELTAVLGALADNGIKGSEAGTHLRNILLAMNPTTDKAANAWEQLGVKAYDSQGNMRNLEEIFMDLDKAMAGMTEQEKTAMKSAMFNKTDLAAVNALLATSADRWDDINFAAENAAGSADAMAKTQLDNLAGDVTLFKSALEGAKIAVSDGLTPSLRDFVQLGTDGLSRLTIALKEGGLTGAMEELGNFIGDGLGMLMEKIPELLGAGGTLLGTILDSVMDILPDALGKIGNFIIDNADSLFDGVEKLLLKVADFLSKNIGGVLNGILKLITKVAKRLPNLVKPIVQMLPQAIKDIAIAIADNAPALIQGVVELIFELCKELPTILIAIGQALPDILDGIFSGLIDNLPQLIAGVVLLVEGLIENLPEILGGIVTKVGEMFGEILTNLLPFGDDLKAIFKGFDFGGFVGGVFGEVRDIIKGIFDFIGTLFDDPAEAIKKAFNGVKDYAVEVFDSLKQIFQGILDLIEEAERRKESEKVGEKINEEFDQLEQETGIRRVRNENGDIIREVADEQKYLEYYGYDMYGLLTNKTANKPAVEVKQTIGGEIDIVGVDKDDAETFRKAYDVVTNQLQYDMRMGKG